jgi:cell division protein FtsL
MMLRRLNWALMLATLASAFALYAIKYDTRRLEVRVQAQERALEKAEIDVTVLTAERAHLARPERLEPLARLIGLAPITSAQYLRIDTKGAGEPKGEAVPADALNR